MIRNSIKESGIRFELEERYAKEVSEMDYKFGFDESKFGEIVYYRTYSRIKADGTNETWPETVLRCINGVMTIRKHYFLTNNLPWVELRAQGQAFRMARSMIQMKWLPPGRSLWTMGTDYLYERGSFCLYNCGFVEVDDLAEDVAWLMNALMSGAGVGYGISPYTNWEFTEPSYDREEIYQIPDTREGWVESVEKLIESYMIEGHPTVEFDYSLIRKAGEPIRGFGGTSSGSAPLAQLHERIRSYISRYINNNISWTRLVADVCNAVGVAVVVGNVRRSAEIALGSPDDEDFMDLKNYEKNPERMSVGWMSNNSVRLKSVEDFSYIPDIAERIVTNGEPGCANMLNIKKFGRFGHEGESERDPAVGLNPCSEIPLESYEVCNLSEVFLPRCASYKEYKSALEDATYYSSTVSLYPTDSPQTNEVVYRNRRIGVSLSGVAEWMADKSTVEAIKWLRAGYDVVRSTNERVNREAGVPTSIRTTTVKPSGTISQLAGVSSGMHYPIYRYAIRRIIMNPYCDVAMALKAANYPNEPSVEFLKSSEAEGRKRFHKYDAYNPSEDVLAYQSETSSVFEVPLYQGKARAIGKVSAWEQFSLLATMQREWSDNSVSCTVYFDPETEGEHVTHMLSMFLPLIKSVSMLPHSAGEHYPQLPYQRLTKKEYESRVKDLLPINWKGVENNNSVPDLYCDGDTCII